jgi:hypothetical protein
LIYASEKTYSDGTFTAPTINVEGAELVGCTIVDDNFDSAIYINHVDDVSIKNVKVNNLIVLASSAYLIRVIASVNRQKVLLDGVKIQGVSGVEGGLLAVLLTSANADVIVRDTNIKAMSIVAGTINVVRASSGCDVTIRSIVADFTDNTSTNRRVVFAVSGNLIVRDNGGHNIINSTGAISAGSGSLAYGINNINRIYYGTAIPTVGTYVKGDKLNNSSPSVGQPKGWICTVAGTPGTWVSEGNL